MARLGVVGTKPRDDIALFVERNLLEQLGQSVTVIDILLITNCGSIIQEIYNLDDLVEPDREAERTLCL
ncbi:MAG: hypothetical protein E5299_00412 [Burkholderia gladioli]|nr:MAG: hypothetical protein E5299_00412 [Burkholderia gladioli]